MPATNVNQLYKIYVSEARKRDANNKSTEALDSESENTINVASSKLKVIIGGETIIPNENNETENKEEEKI